MPCYDPRPTSHHSDHSCPGKWIDTPNEYSKAIDRSINSMSERISENMRLQACLCAMTAELERRGLLSEIVAAAEENSEIGLDIMDLVENHKEKDKQRIREVLRETFSQDEIDLIKSENLLDE